MQWRKRLSSLRIVTVWSVIVLVGLLGVSFTVFYTTQARYFSQRNFRILAAIGDQIDESLESHARTVRSVLSGKEVPPVTSAASAADFPTWFTDARARVPLLEQVQLPMLAKQVASAGAVPTARLTKSGPEFVLSLSYNDVESLKLRARPLLRQILSQERYSAAFDTLLLATTTGEVLFESDQTSIESDQSDQMQVRQLSALLTSPSGSPEAYFQRLSQSTNLIDVTANGATYRMFVQPCCRFLQAPGLVVAGMVSTSRFRSESMAISFSIIVAIVALLLLGVIGAPFLKLVMSAETDRVTPTHVLLVSASCVGGVALLTLSLLDWHAYGRLNRAVDDQLKHLAVEIKTQLATELSAGYAELRCLSDRLATAKPATSQRLADYPPCGTSYEDYDTLAVSDESGMQVIKATRGPWVSELVSVAERPYFKAVASGALWPAPSLHGAGEGPGAYIELLRTWSTGQLRGIIAAPAPSGRDPMVATLTLPLTSVIDAVVMPGFAFAVIDPNGKVLAHSDTQRDLNENLFVETDMNRRLRAAIAARQSKALTAWYWGQAHRMYVMPLDAGTPWSIVALYNQRSAWALQEEWLILALALLAADLLAFALGALILLIAWTMGLRLRHASWIWPQPSRQPAYVFLAGAEFVLLIVFVALINVLSGPALAVAALLGPALVCLLIVAALQHSSRKPQNALTVIPIYSLVGVLTLLLIAVLPAVAFFKVAHDGPTENYVKHRQLRLAQTLVERGRVQASLASDLGHECGAGAKEATWRLNAKSWRPDPLEAGVYYRFFFNTTPLCLDTGPEPPREALDDSSSAAALDPLPPVLKAWLPYGSEASVEMRELSADGGASDPWRWNRQASVKGLPALTLRFGHDPAISLSSAPLRLFPPDPSPYLHPDDERSAPVQPTESVAGMASSDEFGGDLWSSIQAALIALVVLGTCIAAVRFICRRIFLMRLEEPLWAFAPDLSVGENVILVGGTVPSGLNYYVVDFARLAHPILPSDDPNAPRRDAWKDRLNAIDNTDALQIAITNIDVRIYDPQLAEKKLEFIEQVVLRQNRPVILMSKKSTKEIAEAIPRLRDRWETLFSSFATGGVPAEPHKESEPHESERGSLWSSIQACLGQLWAALRGPRGGAWRRLRDEVWKVAPSHAARLNAILVAESNADDVLGRICGNIHKDLVTSNGLVDTLTADDLLDQIGRRAGTHYRRLWIGCTKAEKVVLAHIAEDGLVNAKCRPIVRSLMRKGLIRACPDFRLMNTTFERFVLSGPQLAECTEFESRREASTWDKFQLPFAAVLAGALLFFVMTQKALFDSTIASLGAAATAVPAFFKMFGLLRDRTGAATVATVAAARPPDPQEPV